MDTKAMNNYNEGMKEETCKESKKEITEGELHQPNFEIYIDENRFKATKWVHNEIATKDQTVKGTNILTHINEKKY